MNRFGSTFFCIHGNHENRPQNIASYKEKEWNGGRVMYEADFPNILFPIDGEIFELEGKKCITTISFSEGSNLSNRSYIGSSEP